MQESTRVRPATPYKLRSEAQLTKERKVHATYWSNRQFWHWVLRQPRETTPYYFYERRLVAESGFLPPQTEFPSRVWSLEPYDNALQKCTEFRIPCVYLSPVPHLGSTFVTSHFGLRRDCSDSRSAFWLIETEIRTSDAELSMPLWPDSATESFSAGIALSPDPGGRSVTYSPGRCRTHEWDILSEICNTVHSRGPPLGADGAVLSINGRVLILSHLDQGYSIYSFLHWT